MQLRRGHITSLGLPALQCTARRHRRGDQEGSQPPRAPSPHVAAQPDLVQFLLPTGQLVGRVGVIQHVLLQLDKSNLASGDIPAVQRTGAAAQESLVPGMALTTAKAYLLLL